VFTNEKTKLFISEIKLKRYQNTAIQKTLSY